MKCATTILCLASAGLLAIGPGCAASSRRASVQGGERRERAERDGAGETSAKIDLAAAPAAVRARIVELLAGAPIAQLERNVEDGATTYEVDWSAGGRRASATLDETGAILEREAEVDPARLPPAVVAALQRARPAGRIVSAEDLETHLYEVRIEVDGRTEELKVSSAGALEPPRRHAAKSESEEEDEDED